MQRRRTAAQIASRSTGSSQAMPPWCWRGVSSSPPGVHTIRRSPESRPPRRRRETERSGGSRSISMDKIGWRPSALRCGHIFTIASFSALHPYAYYARTYSSRISRISPRSLQQGRRATRTHGTHVRALAGCALGRAPAHTATYAHRTQARSHFAPHGRSTFALVDEAPEFVSQLRVVLELAAVVGGARRRRVLANSSSAHAHVRALQYDGDATRRGSTLECVADLLREALLHL